MRLITRRLAWALLWLPATALVACVGTIGEAPGGDPGTGDPCPVEGEIQSCYPGDPATQSIGECQDGTATCSGGKWTECEGYLLPEEEICDELDNNCDGVVDEGCGCSQGDSRPCYTGPAATREIGICSDGVQHCGANQTWGLDCIGQVLPQEEACDSIDNNCNGLVDDGCSCVDGTTQPCYGGPAGTKDVGVCQGGVQTCAGGQWPAVCPGEVTPSTEKCNSADDNCNGQTDEGDPGGGGSCNTGQPGVCAAGTKHCTAGSIHCAANNQPSGEVCDNQDNNCNGQTDEGDPGGGGSCNTGLPGVCAAGTNHCTGGSVQCVANQQPSTETCDAVDNNCNGQTDEGNPDGGGSCTTGQPGVCGPGTWLCQSGSLNCAANQGPSSEQCFDGLDNDCNGTVDNGCPCQHNTCSTGVALAAGCDSCVSAICNVDSYCCSGLWDSICVGRVQSVCGSGVCAGKCPHAPCDAGPSSTPFYSGCDSPGTCVSQICSADAFCCDIDWDTICANQVTSLCGLSC